MKHALPIRIAGVGRYLPARVVPNAEVERLGGLPAGAIDRTAAGVKERRWVDRETNSFMGAAAAREALEEAGLAAGDLDLVLNASGTQEHVIPDGAPLLQRELGIAHSGIPCISVHTTCLSFLVALNLAANYLYSGQYRRILIVSSDIGSRSLDPKDPESFVLFGDAAAAVVVCRPAEGEPSRMTRYLYRTFGDGAMYTRILTGTSCPPQRPGAVLEEESLFHMDGRKVYRLARKYGAETLEMLKPGLSRGLGEIRMVVPHQASGFALRAYAKYGWPPEKIAVTLDRLGNCIAASIPVTLYEVIREGRVRRGERMLLVGTGAGLSLGAAVVVF